MWSWKSLMKILDAKVNVCCPGRNFVRLKLTTEDGVYGLGDATLNGRELAVASYLADHVLPLLIGRDARRIEDIWHYLYKGAYWRRGPVTMSAIAAVDTALWDIKAKALNVPLYQLLGGASRDAVLVYGHAGGADIEETVQAVAQYLELGYKAIRTQSGIPGLASTYGVGRSGSPTSPLRETLRQKISGLLSVTSTLSQLCSRDCARNSHPTCTCCTTRIIA
jgi:mannonate dehydratase